jgi:2-hydroxychromene-2-carboxylate isomerase
VLHGLGTKPPALAQPWKTQYLIRDLKRLAGKYGIPFNRETGEPVFSLLASRVALVGLEQGWGVAFIKAAFRANFADNLDIADKKVIGRIIDLLGQSAGDVLALAVSPEIKSRLREQTEEAARLGIFGSPTFFVDGEMFWGQDRLPDAIKWASAA